VSVVCEDGLESDNEFETDDEMNTSMESDCSSPMYDAGELVDSSTLETAWRYFTLQQTSAISFERLVCAYMLTIECIDHQSVKWLSSIIQTKPELGEQHNKFVKSARVFCEMEMRWCGYHVKTVNGALGRLSGCSLECEFKSLLLAIMFDKTSMRVGRAIIDDRGYEEVTISSNNLLMNAVVYQNPLVSKTGLFELFVQGDKSFNAFGALSLHNNLCCVQGN
jgi:hypothetical protein